MPTDLQDLRILHLASSERWTGVAEPVCSLAREQRRMGCKVWVGCVPGQSFERRMLEWGLAGVADLHLNRRLNPMQLFSDLRLLPRFCREHGVDIVHCHLLHDHWVASAALGALRRAQGGRPLLMRTVHTGSPPRRDFFHQKLFAGRTDQVMCVSQAAARQIESAYGLPVGAVAAVRGGVDLARFSPCASGESMRRELGIPPDAPVAGLVSRLRAGRGLRWLLQAVPALLDRVPEARIIVVGRGELKYWFRDEIRRNPGYRGRVIAAGYRKADLPNAYAAMDVSLFLGLGSEGSCRAILEAMGCGRPTIGAAIGAVPEIIDEGETGRLVRHRDAGDLTGALAEMLGDRTRCAAMGCAARTRAERLFSENARAETVMAVYAKALDSQRREQQ